MSVPNDFYLADVFSAARSNQFSYDLDELHKNMSVEPSEIERDLSKSGKDFFGRWLNLNGELQLLDNADSFNLGFRMGAKYIYDIFVNEASKEN